MDTLKSDMIHWILSLNDESLTQSTWEWMKTHIAKEKTIPENPFPFIRQPGFGKHFFKSISPDFNEPLEEFKDYML